MKSENVNRVASTNVIAASETSTMFQAAEIMKKHHIRHLPVMNETGRIVGILSDRDLRPLQRLTSDSGSISNEKHLVRHYMNSPVLEASQSESLQSVAQRMLHEKVSCFIVVDEYTRPCGIVTTDDLLKYFVETSEGRDRDSETQVGTLFQYLKVPMYE